MKPSSSEIENQVNLILESKDFQASSKLSEFLRFIVKETVKGNEDQLKGYTIATRVLGRGDDFDQSKDPIVRILAGRLRRALEYYYHTNGKSDRVHIDIPVGSYIPEFRFNNNGYTDIFKETSRQLGLKGQNALRIAVLPFRDLSGDNKNRLFLSALYEDIIYRLSHFRLLEISALKTGKDNIYDQYRENSTRFILEGSLRREKNSLKIFTELIDLKQDQVIRADKYDIKFRDNASFISGENLADKIASVIGSEYGIISRSVESEIKPKAYTYLFDYEFIVGFYSLQHYLEKKALRSFIQSSEKVLRVRPDNATLRTVAAGSSLFSLMFDLNAVKDPLAYARSHLIIASNLEPDNQMTGAVTALLYFLEDKNKLFRKEINTALSLNPASPYYRGLYGFLLINSGVYQKGIKFLNSGIEKSYNFPSWWNIALAAYYFRKKDFENSYNESRKINLPDSFWSYVYTIASLEKLRRNEELKKEMTRLKKLNPGFNKLYTGLLRRLIKDNNLLNELTGSLSKAEMKII